MFRMISFLMWTVLLCAGCSSINTVNRSLSVYDRVIQSGKIRCGYIIDHPGCLRDPNTGKLSGIGVEAIELLAKNLALKVEFTEEVDWATMIQGLENDRYDIVAAPVWPQANRARVAGFSKPLYFSPVFAYIKSGSFLTKMRDIKEINSPKYCIASVDGATPEVIAREDFPQARLYSMPQQCEISQMLLAVATKKADIAFIEPAVAYVFSRSNPKTIEKFPVREPLRVFPNCWIFKRGQMEFKSMIDTELDQLINSGAIDKLLVNTSQLQIHYLERRHRILSSEATDIYV